MEALLNHPVIDQQPGTFPMADFEVAFENVPQESTPPEFNMQLVMMFMRAPANSELSKTLSGVIAGDMVIQSINYEQQLAMQAAEVKARGDHFRAFEIMTQEEDKDKKDKLELTA